MQETVVSAWLGDDGLGDPIVGEQTGLREVLERVRLVAPSGAPVLVFGETGSGKELIARIIHGQSPRQNKPFLRVNCGAIPPDLIDSQLFGHEEGAFTGATGQHRGWFERADGGTLLLDEVAELPPAAQVRLLRVLQDGWLERVGGSEPVNVDVRIVAATHRDLPAMIAEGDFREDLWYRLAVFPLVLPPLRHRTQDIPALVALFVERASQRFGVPLTRPTVADIRLLSSYEWPGNVRELAAVVDRAVILGRGQRLAVDAALGVTHNLGTTPRKQPLLRRAGGGGTDTGCPFATLDEATRQHIETALGITQGRVEGPHGAALLLDVNPHTLRGRMRKLGIDWRRFRQ